jgi:hypothetical protein
MRPALVQCKALLSTQIRSGLGYPRQPPYRVVGVGVGYRCLFRVVVGFWGLSTPLSRARGFEGGSDHRGWIKSHLVMVFQGIGSAPTSVPSSCRGQTARPIGKKVLRTPPFAGSEGQASFERSSLRVASPGICPTTPPVSSAGRPSNPIDACDHSKSLRGHPTRYAEYTYHEASDALNGYIGDVYVYIFMLGVCPARALLMFHIENRRNPSHF